MSESESNRSIIYVVAGVFLVVVAITWCCAASAYARREGLPGIDAPRRLSGAGRTLALRAVLQLGYNGVAQIPSAPSVLSYSWNNEPLILQIGFGLAGLVLVGGVVMRVVESKLSQPVKRYRRR